MDGRGRVFDTHSVFVERLWRTVRDEDIDIDEQATVPALLTGLSDYVDLYRGCINKTLHLAAHETNVSCIRM